MAGNPASSPSSGDPAPAQALPPEPASDSPPDPESKRNAGQLRQVGWVALAIVLYYVGSFLFQNFTATGNFDQGLALQKERKCREAMVKLDRAIWFDPQMVQAYHVRAICHWRRDNIDQALADFSATVRLKPDYAPGYNGRGYVHRYKGNLDAALADWDTAIRLDPAHRDSRLRRAEVLRERDEVAGALAEYDALIAWSMKEREAQAPDSPAVPYDVLSNRNDKEQKARMGRAALLRDKGEHGAALAEYDTVLHLRSYETSTGSNVASTAFFARAATLREQGAIEAALAEAEKGIPLWPDVASGYRERALIALFHTDKPAAAAADLAKAVEHAFSYRRTMGLFDAGAEALGITVTDRVARIAPDTPFVPAAYDLVLQLHVARARAGEEDKEELRRNAQEISETIYGLGGPFGMQVDMSFPAWPGPILKLFLGTATPEEVRAAAQAPGRDARHSPCAADFYLAQYHLQKGAADEARRLLQSAADGCPVWAPERSLARAELKRPGR
jgi:tetratricopeptide (TPR) repeat protein